MEFSEWQNKQKAEIIEIRDKLLADAEKFAQSLITHSQNQEKKVFEIRTSPGGRQMVYCDGARSNRAKMEEYQKSQKTDTRTLVQKAKLLKKACNALKKQNRAIEMAGGHRHPRVDQFLKSWAGTLRNVK